MNDVNYINDTKIFVSSDTFELNPYTWKDGCYQLYAIEKFFNIAKKNASATILDIGAQSGAFSLMAKYLPNTTWHAFEPDPVNESLLRENLNINSINNVTVYSKALGDNIGETILNINTKHRGLNTLGTNLKRFSVNDVQKINVEIDTLDNLFLNTKIDLIKIDTEGCEYNIIKGGKELIKKYKPVIFLEYYENNLQQFNLSINDLQSLFKEINYEITWIEEDNAILEFIN